MPVTPEVVGNKADAVFYASGAEVPVVSINYLDGTKLPTPLETKILVPGPKGSLLEHRMPKGQVVPAHRFAHDFINTVVRGGWPSPWPDGSTRVRTKTAGVGPRASRSLWKPWRTRSFWSG